MDFEEAKADRDFRLNPPEFAPGQSANNDGWGDLELGSSSVEQPYAGSTGNSDIGSILNNNSTMSQINNGLNNPMNQGTQQSQQKRAPEDVMFDGAILAGKGIFSYAKALASSLTNNTANDWHLLGERIFYESGIVFAVGVVASLINMVAKTNNHPGDLCLGSLMSFMVSIMLLYNFKKDKSVDIPDPEPEPDETTSTDMNYDDIFSNDLDDYSESEDYIEEDYSEDDGDDVWDTILGDDTLFEETQSNSVDSDSFNLEETLSNMAEITPGTQTRQYLFETFCSVLPNITPNFSEMVEITPEEDEFYIFEELVRGAAEQVGTKEENIPELTSLYENPFIYRLNCTRPSGLKEDKIAEEIAKTYSRDANNMQVRDGVYATVESAIGVFTVNLFKGVASGKKEGVTISLCDVYKKISEFMLDPKNIMPLVWGVNELGKPMYCSLIDCDSIMISGEPAGGKSWKGQSIIAQLCMFNSPKEIEIYVFDHKNYQSDYRYISQVVPHVKYFCGDKSKINKGIKQVIDMAVAEREIALRDGGYLNIKDYNKDHPTDKLPYIYVVVDELMSLMNYFIEQDDKESQTMLKSSFSTIVSKLRYLGVRVILFPHRIVDSVINKNTYALVSTRAAVRQLNTDEIKNAVGVTPKEFPYKLVAQGDMALQAKEIAGGNTVFCHAEVLTSSNSGNKKLYDFIGAVWKKLEPDCKCIEFNGSIGGSIRSRVDSKLKSLNTDNIENFNIPKDHTDGISTYKYKGFASEESTGDLEEIDLSLGGIEDTDNEVDESFWESLE